MTKDEIIALVAEGVKNCPPPFSGDITSGAAIRAAADKIAVALVAPLKENDVAAVRRHLNSLSAVAYDARELGGRPITAEVAAEAFHNAENRFGLWRTCKKSADKSARGAERRVSRYAETPRRSTAGKTPRGETGSARRDLHRTDEFQARTLKKAR